MKRIIILLTLLVMAPAAAMAAGIEADLTPDRLDISALYNGAALNLAGRAPEGAQVVVRFTGAPEDLRMKQKGKALGLLWMNLDTLHFHGAPKVCLVESSVALAEMGQAASALGVAATVDKIGVEPAGVAKEALGEFTKLKRSEGLYRETSGAVKLGEVRDGLRDFTAALGIPSRLSPGDYVVELFAVKDGLVVATAVKPFEVRLVGLPELISRLAFEHGAWYGILASIIAVLAGLGIGLVFQSREAH